MKKAIFTVIVVIALFASPSLAFADDSGSASYLANLALVLPEAFDVTVDYVAHKSCGTVKARDMTVDELQGLFSDRQFSQFLLLKLRGDDGREYQAKLGALCRKNIAKN
ncbi:MAG: hypothetical protein HQL09_08300 [Nitrospirae bacterium]|nr:hypothetical protein [Nitrospirota bacterium]